MLGSRAAGTWKVRSQSCSSGGGAMEGMRRLRAWPALALRRSPKVVVGLGVQGPRVLRKGNVDVRPPGLLQAKPFPWEQPLAQDQQPPTQPPSPASPWKDSFLGWWRLEALPEVPGSNPAPAGLLHGFGVSTSLGDPES